MSTLQTPNWVRRRTCQLLARAQGRLEQDQGPCPSNLTLCLSTLSGRLDPGAVFCLLQIEAPLGSFQGATW